MRENLLTIPLAVMIHRRTVLPEEADMERIFGQDYREYRGSVRRWV